VCRLPQGDVQWLTKNYYVVRRHRGSDNAGAAETPATSRVLASLRDTVMPAAMRQDVSSHLHDLLLRDTSETIREDAAQIPVAVNDVKALVLAGGALRFYVRAVMQSDTSCTKVEAWITPLPVLRIAAMAASTCMYDSLKEPGRLVDVYDLGDGRTGLIVDYDLPDGRALELIEYRDGVVLAHMPTLQSISASA
jgi:hypothetical protein